MKKFFRIFVTLSFITLVKQGVAEEASSLGDNSGIQAVPTPHSLEESESANGPSVNNLDNLKDVVQAVDDKTVLPNVVEPLTNAAEDFLGNKEQGSVLKVALPSSTEIKSEKTIELGQDILDVRPIEKLDFWWQQPWLWLGVSLLGLLWLYGLRRRRKNQKRVLSSVLPLSPYERAMQSIEEARVWIREKTPKRFASGLSDAVRGYLSSVFGLPAPECTTEEVLRKIDKDRTFDPSFVNEIKPFLEGCDLAKFTKQAFHYQALDELYKQAKELVSKADKVRQIQQMAKQPLAGNTPTVSVE